MAGKHDSATPTATTTEASWRPFAQKLSGFMRHGSTKNRKVSPSQPVQNVGDTDRRNVGGYDRRTVGDYDRRSVFKLGRQSSYKAPSATETTFEFKPLEVDISKLESMRLAEGWLEQEPPPPKKPDPELLKKKPLPKPPPSSSTPIADLFASKAEFDSGLSLSTRRHTHLFLDRAAAAASGGSSTTSNDAQTIARKPVPTSPAPTTTTTKTTTTTEPARQPPATHQATYSILERGRPIEPKDVIPAEPVAALPGDSHSSIAQKRRSLQSSQSNAGPSTSWSSASKPPAVGVLDTRHSMFAAPVAASTTGRIEAGEGELRPTTRSASANPLDRIQAWQKSITSAPMAPPPSNALGTPQASAPVRKVSPRGLAGNRLAWIRELEEKKSNDLRKDIGVLKKQAGGVSSKLAMFENKGASAAPISNPRMPPLSRSNSTTSRMSSVGLKSTTTTQDNATVTPRTSIDTTRSSVHRNSGVMSYYDDSFREKMEGLVSQLAEKDDEDKNKANPAPRKRRITASFVSVEGGRKAAQAMAAAMLSGEKPQVVADSDAKAEEEKKEEEAPAVAPAQEEEASKAEEVAEPTPAAVEPEQEAEAPVVETEKVEETATPAEVVEVAAPETPAAAEAQPEVAAPVVAEEKVAEEVAAQEEPVVAQAEPEVAQAEPEVAQAEPEVAAEQSEPVVEAAPETVTAEPVVVEQEKEEIAAAAEVPLPESESDDEATVADEKSVYVESVFEDAVEDQQAKIDI